MRLDFAGRFATVDGFDVHYWDEGGGAPLLLIHGLGVAVESWGCNVEALATKHRVFALDIPGFGRSSRPEDGAFYSRERIGQFLGRFVDQLGISQPLSVAGHSMGGMLAIQFALTHPERVRHLIVIDAAGLGREIHPLASLAAVRPVGELLFQPTRPLVRLIVRMMVYRHELITDRFVDRLLAYAKVPGSHEAFVACLRMTASFRGQAAPYTASDLRKMARPTLVIWGAQDRFIPVSHAQTALDSMPDCRAVVLHGAGHPPQMDRWETFNQLVLEFLANGRLSPDVERAARANRLVWM